MSQVKLDHDTAHAVELAVALVNTEDVVGLVDALGGREDLERLVRAGAYEKALPIGDGDVRAVRDLRGRLRAIFAMPEAEAVAALNELAAHARPRLSRHGDSGWHFHYTADDTPWAQTLAADLAMGLLAVIRDFGFARLGICASDSCEDVFVDLSRNGSKRWCDSRSCGNQAAVRAYRARQADR
jgi:predicted RNA-binding Zn ribbon-like protein